MSKIEYVCLSDLHFGDSASVLTTLGEGGDIDPTRPDEPLRKLVDCLRSLIAKCGGARPKLVLAGDALEFALASDNVALMAFERFLALLAEGGEPVFSEILFIPGNHDHHIWETARETQYAAFIKSAPADRRLAPPWHTTTLVTDERHPAVRSELLSNLLQYRAGDATTKISVVYPNHGVFSADGTRAVVFSHGHYIESIYRLMSKLRELAFTDTRKLECIYDIEEENFAWIDFFWSMMGRQGEAGKGVDHIYKALHDPASLEKIIDNLSKNVAAEIDLPMVPESLEPWAIRTVLRRVVMAASKAERDDTETSPGGLSAEGVKGLEWFVERPLRDQIVHEGGGLMPLSMALVWGHTHKPFSARMDFDGYPHGVEVFNTGGWVIESPTHQPIRGGAVVVVNSELEVVSLDMFRDVPEGSAVRVCSADVERESLAAFRKQVEEAIAADSQTWTTFSAVTAKAVAVRHAILSHK